MTGLPRVQTSMPPRDLFMRLSVKPLEQLTEALRRGDAFTEQELADMQALQRRLKGFSDALDMRTAIIE